jgi:hypothetical protein
MIVSLRVLHLIALSLWVGSIVFFSFIVAPGIFGALPSQEAGRVIGTIFPRYYGLGIGCGLVTVLSALALQWQGNGDWRIGLALTTGMLALTLYAGLVIQPRAAAMRPLLHDPATEATTKPEFDRLHKLAVALNVIVLLDGLVALGLRGR